ncbi:hypothetical protein ACVWWN_006692 [Mycobacterium sp. URHB0021]
MTAQKSAVAPLAPEDVAGEAHAVDPDQRRDLPSADTTAAGQAEGELLAAVGEPVERVGPRGRAESVSEPRQQHDLNTDHHREQVHRVRHQSWSKRSESA